MPWAQLPGALQVPLRRLACQMHLKVQWHPNQCVAAFHLQAGLLPRLVHTIFRRLKCLHGCPRSGMAGGVDNATAPAAPDRPASAGSDGRWWRCSFEAVQVYNEVWETCVLHEGEVAWKACKTLVAIDNMHPGKRENGRNCVMQLPAGVASPCSCETRGSAALLHYRQ